MASDNWEKMLKFILQLSSEFEVSSNATRIAIVSYSSEAKVYLKFNDIQKYKNPIEEMAEVINAIPQMPGYFYIDKGLRLTQEEVFVERNGMRIDTQKVTILTYQTLPLLMHS